VKIVGDNEIRNFCPRKFEKCRKREVVRNWIPKTDKGAFVCTKLLIFFLILEFHGISSKLICSYKEENAYKEIKFCQKREWMIIEKS